MKVSLEKDYRRLYTLEDLDAAKAVIAYEKEYDEESVNGWAEYAVNEALHGEGSDYCVDCCEKVFEATARTARNSRIAWDTYGEGSGYMDVWVEATAKTSRGFIEVGAYLSDIWKTGAERYKQHMYVAEYKRA